MPDFAITPEAKADAAKAVQSLQGTLFTPETMGAPLIQAILRNAVPQGKFLDNSTIEIPLTVTLTLPGAITAEAAGEKCGRCCITSFGHELICVEICSHPA